MLVLTKNLELKKSSMKQIKYFRINYNGWYCPISNHSVMVRADGYAVSGVCGNLMLSTPAAPWWNNFENIKQKINSYNNICSIKLGCTCGNDLNSLKAINKKTYDIFIEKINDYNYNQLDILKDNEEIIAHGSPYYINRFDLTLDYGKKCNFDCAYCSLETHDNFSKFLSLDKIELLFKELNFSENSNGYIFITGGEPTLSKELLDLVDLAWKYKFKKVKLNSNGTASVRLYKALIEKDVKITVTFHEEFTTDRHIEKVYNLYKEYPKNIKVKILGDEKNSSEYFARVKSKFKEDFTQIRNYPIFFKKNDEIVNSIEEIKKLNEKYGRP